jgi:hypothetical protein
VEIVKIPGYWKRQQIQKFYFWTELLTGSERIYDNRNTTINLLKNP